MGDEISAKSINEAIGTLIAKLCYKAADDIGDGVAQKTSEYRQKNALSILEKANNTYEKISSTGNEHAHPRLVHHIIEEGSWNDNDHVQSMWAGLLATSCTEDGNDESNLLFINILKQLTSVEVLILNYACEKCEKSISKAGWITSEKIDIELDDLIKLTGVTDLHRLDRELDHLRSIELIETGFHPDSTAADITPGPLSLQLYVRCQGYIGSPTTYFGLDEEEKS